MEEFFDARDELLYKNFKDGFERLKSCPLYSLSLEATKEREWVLKCCEEIFPQMAKSLDWHLRREGQKCFYAGPKSTRQEEGWCLAYGSIVFYDSVVELNELLQESLRLRRAVDEYQVGFAAAKLLRSMESSIEVRFRWACIASEAGDREGFYYMGFYAEHTYFKTNLDARQWYEKSAILGDKTGMFSFSEFFPKNSEEQLDWIIKSGCKGGIIYKQKILRKLTDSLENFWNRLIYKNEQIGIVRSIYKFGAFFVKEIVEEVGQPSTFWREWKHIPSNRFSGVVLHLKWKERAQDAVFCWMLVARRLRLYKDISLLIAQVIWSGRSTDFFKDEDRTDEKDNQEN